MAKSAYEIIHQAAGWSASYDYTEVNGPLSLSQDGVVFLKNHTNIIDNRGMMVIKSRAFRKSGTAVNDTEARFNATGATGFRQITRYANNVARVCTDVMLKRDTVVKGVLSLGSFELPGTWTRLLTLHQDGTSAWTELKPGELVQAGLEPMAWVFEREDGFRLEVGAGFDLWRWRNGIDGLPMETVITVADGGVRFERRVISVTEPVTPAPRDYRFCYHIAWTAPAAAQSAADIPAVADITSGSLDVSALGDEPALTLDLNTLPVPPSARIDGKEDGPLCWESKAALAAAKTIIRQLAALGNTGRLHISGGLTPSRCTFGKHVDRPRTSTPHWDLNGIICFSEWVRQTLGDGWRITCAQDGVWKELPSVQCLFGANGFSD